MIIDTIPQGSYQTNSYILRNDAASKECVIIDTGLENIQLLSFLENEKLTPTALILTHGHLDHIYGVPDLREKYPNIIVAIHQDDAEMLTDGVKNMSKLAGILDEFVTEPADLLLKESETLEYSGVTLSVITVPGHTPGGICLHLKEENAVFVGDCVFAGSVGRTDFPGYAQAKCHEQLVSGIKEKILTLPEESKLYCGHGPSTTLRCEKKHNPYLNGDF